MKLSNITKIIGKRGWLGVIIFAWGAFSFVTARSTANLLVNTPIGPDAAINASSMMYYDEQAKTLGFNTAEDYLTSKYRKDAGVQVFVGVAIFLWGFLKYGRNIVLVLQPTSEKTANNTTVLPIAQQTPSAPDPIARIQEIQPISAAPSSVAEVVARHGLGIKDSKIWFAPNIPANKLQTAIRSYAQAVLPGDVLMLVDNTFWGGGADGMLITKQKLYTHDMKESPKEIAIAEIKTVSVSDGFVARQLLINDNKFATFNMLDKANDTKICKLLTELASVVGDSR